jgi:hypothetical protein
MRPGRAGRSGRPGVRQLLSRPRAAAGLPARNLVTSPRLPQLEQRETHNTAELRALRQDAYMHRNA